MIIDFFADQGKYVFVGREPSDAVQLSVAQPSGGFMLAEVQGPGVEAAPEAVEGEVEGRVVPFDGLEEPAHGDAGI